MIDIEGDTLIFRESGRRLNAVCGVIGLQVSAGDPEIFTGFDGRLGEYDETLTPMELAELAVYMRGRWEEIAAQAKEAMAVGPEPARSDQPLPADGEEGCVTDDPHASWGGKLVYDRTRESPANEPLTDTHVALRPPGEMHELWFENPEADAHLNSAFHHLWTTAVHQDGYVKAEWLELARLLGTRGIAL